MSSDYYICHYCSDYMTDSRGDMKKHFSRKIKCYCLTIIPYENAKDLTLNKKFNLKLNISKLEKNDKLFIINNYNDKYNVIDENFKHIKNNKEPNNKKYNNDKNDEDENDKENDSDKDENKISSNKYQEFDKEYYNKEKNRFICNKCYVEYTRRFNLIKHHKNKKACEYKQYVNKMIQENKELALIKKEKEEEERNKYKEHIIQNIQNIGTQNIQNIGTLNNNNNNNNTQNNNYNFAIRDFVNDRYDISHIKDSFYEKEDFFLYPNFLQMIMENEKNRNMFIVDKEAVFYTENELNKMSSDKAGYMILDKLSESFDQLLYRQNQEARDYYSFISKYYYIVKGQYKHDTVYKDYDIKEKQFVYTANSRAFRSRDKHLSKITSTLNKFDKETRDVINKSGYQIKSIPLINPNIEDYASVKMRYRDLKDDKW
jgi:hypothetical protein